MKEIFLCFGSIPKDVVGGLIIWFTGLGGVGGVGYVVEYGWGGVSAWGLLLSSTPSLDNQSTTYNAKISKKNP